MLTSLLARIYICIYIYIYIHTHYIYIYSYTRECAYVLFCVAELSTLSIRSRSLYVRFPVYELLTKERLSILRFFNTCQNIRFVNRNAKRSFDDKHCVLCRKGGRERKREREKERSSPDGRRESLMRWLETIFVSARLLFFVI